MLTQSKHNIIGRIVDSDDWYVVNPLSGEADVITSELAGALISGSGQPLEDASDELAEKGYLVDPAKEDRRFKRAYLDFVDGRDDDEIQIFFVPTYACNFACSYCYQGEYGHEATFADRDVIDAFFTHLDTHFSDRRKYITVFGGEPLLPGSQPKSIIEHLIGAANARGLELAFVTNGYTLSDYVPLLSKAQVREIQVTLDGVGSMHDERRPHRSGVSTFDRVVSGIDAALSADIPINLRVVIDRDNIEGLADVARLAIDRGWTDHSLFKTQLGRNYELHSCQANEGKLFSRLEMYQELYRLIGERPEILELHRPAYSISRFLFDEGRLPDPLFDACPACKTEWAFDYTGAIYSCTATVGKQDEALGTFFPESSLNDGAVENWQDRDVLAIASCRTCNLRLACGGGCGSVAKNQTGSINGPDCRPVTELIGLGLSFYANLTATP